MARLLQKLILLGVDLLSLYMMLQRKSFSLFSLTLVLALVTAPKPLMSLLLANPAYAQSPTPSSFPLPSAVPDGTTVRVDGSASLAAINQALKQRFEAQYAGTTVNLATQGTDAALRAVQDETIDLAAIGRLLTETEKAQGLVEAPISREKIAIFVGAENPFQGELTFEQFAAIFRGEITDWSEIGGVPGPIRFIDRPEFSDTRKALSNYSVFQTAPFATGATATKVDQDDTAAVISQLGRDGISYGIADQVLNQNAVRVLPMHGTLPDDPRYPYSQPRSYVYREPASPAVQAFLGYVASPVGQQAIAEARADEAAAVAAAISSAPLNSSPPASPDGAVVPEATSSPEAGVVPEATSSPETAVVPSPNGATSEENAASSGWLPWLLLPLAGVLGLLIWGLKGRNSRSTVQETGSSPPVVPPPVGPSSVEESLAEQASFVAADPTPTEQVVPVAKAEVEPPVVEEPSVIEELPVEGPLLEEVPPSNTLSETSLPRAGAIAGSAIAAGVGAAALAGLVGAGRDHRSRIVLTPRTVHQGYAYWETPEAEKAALRQQGGEYLTLRIADVTGIDLEHQEPHTVQQYLCTESDQDQFVVLPQPDRDYVAEIGYLTADQRWLMLARSAPVRPASLETVPAVPTVPTINEPIVEVTEEPAIETTQELEGFGEAIDEPIGEITEAPVGEMTEAPVGEAIDEPVGEIAEESERYVESTLEPAQEPEPTFNLNNVVIAGGMVAGAAMAAGGALTEEERAQTEVEAAKFDLGQTDLSSEELASVDESLPDLPVGYGESWITLLPRDPQWAYTYWDVPDEHRQALRQQGGQRLALRFYDVTDVDVSFQNPHSLQQYDCDEMARDWYIPVPISDRNYIVEIGYVAGDGRWLMLARSNPVRIPPIYPVDWYEEQFITIDWEDELRDRTFLELVPPGQKTSFDNPIYDHIFGLAESAEAQRVAGSLFGSMQAVPQESVSSFALASGSGMGMQTTSGVGMMSGAGMAVPAVSGVGMMSGAGMYSLSGIGMSGVGMAVPTMSGIGMSGVGMSGIGMYSMSGIGMSGVGMSGIGMSGIGMYSMSGVGLYSMSGVGMSGIGFSASMPPLRSRKFWLLADAELIVYGATEPDATVTIAGRPVRLNPDGTFRFQMSFQDGMIDFPILAVAADGEQTRSIHLTFNRETPSRHTNPKEEAQDEPF